MLVRPDEHLRRVLYKRPPSHGFMIWLDEINRSLVLDLSILTYGSFKLQKIGVYLLDKQGVFYVETDDYKNSDWQEIVR
jgi:hypothetical protein